jgi:hypothetical protein
MSVQDKIAELERQVARKKALVNAKINLPKDTPEDVKLEVTAVIQGALLKLAESDSATSGSSEIFTAEEITVLKLLANRALTKPAAPASKPEYKPLAQSSSAELGDKVHGKIEKNPAQVEGSYLGREAEIMTLDAVPVRQRGKVQAMEKCKVMEVRPDGYLHILTIGGVRFNVLPEDLNFDIESN